MTPSIGSRSPNCSRQSKRTPSPSSGSAASCRNGPAAAPRRPCGSPRRAPKAREERLPAATENVIRVETERIDAVLDLVGELIIAKSMMQELLAEMNRSLASPPLRARSADLLLFQAQILKKLQRAVMKIRMVPVEQMFRRLPRVVRDTAKQLGREVEVVIAGENTDLDKSILDALAEPMMHLAAQRRRSRH